MSRAELKGYKFVMDDLVGYQFAWEYFSENDNIDNFMLPADYARPYENDFLDLNEVRWIINEWYQYERDVMRYKTMATELYYQDRSHFGWWFGFSARRSPLDSLMNYTHGDRWFVVEARGRIDEDVEAMGRIDKDNDKILASEMRLVREIPLRRLIGFVVACARRSLKNFDYNFPKDDRPRRAIEAVEAYLKNPTRETRLPVLSAAGVVLPGSPNVMESMKSSVDAAESWMHEAYSAVMTGSTTSSPWWMARAARSSVSAVWEATFAAADESCSSPEGAFWWASMSVRSYLNSVAELAAWSATESSTLQSMTPKARAALEKEMFESSWSAEKDRQNKKLLELIEESVA